MKFAKAILMLAQFGCSEMSKCQKNCMSIGGVAMTIKQLSESGNEELREKICPSGHGLIELSGELDCCTVCGRQRDVKCDADKTPCDSSIGLECIYADKKAPYGTCKPKPGNPCFANDEEYKTGENFFPNCKTECICVDGVIGCRKAANPTHCEGETIMAMAAHTKPIDTVIVRPADQDNNVSACRIQSTKWTPCSKTCGWGFSERITNNNPECSMIKEFMLCEMRKCEISIKKEIPLARRSRKYSRARYSRSKRQLQCVIKKNRKIKIQRASKKTKLRFSGCESTKAIKMNYCPACDGLCCPDMTVRKGTIGENKDYSGFKVKKIKFKCENGDKFEKNIMLIRKCHCGKQCKSANLFNLTRRRLQSDTITPRGQA